MLLIYNQSVSVCDSPQIPDNGSVEVSLDGRSASYFCDMGFTLSGESTVLCSNDGTGWSSVAPVCGKEDVYHLCCFSISDFSRRVCLSQVLSVKTLYSVFYLKLIMRIRPPVISRQEI